MAIGNDIHIGRKNVIITLMVIVFVVYILRLLQLQIFDETYKNSADNNAFLHKTRYPARGLIYDRNGKLLVYNKPAYDVMVIINEVHDLDTIDFCRTVNITKDQFCSLIEKMKRQPGYTPYTPQLTHSPVIYRRICRSTRKTLPLPWFLYSGQNASGIYLSLRRTCVGLCQRGD